jgi:hypothetical protein
MEGMYRTLLVFLLLAVPLRAADYRTLTGQHITLLTDVPPNREVDALPSYFDQAFEQWCEYFHVRSSDHRAWRVRGILLRGPESRQRFVAAGQMPADLWDFKSGYSIDRDLWLYDQTSDYYRRHLLLHEGVHCFMYSLLGGIGPPWYGEGMAELLATHKLEGQKLTVNYFPKAIEEVPKLGRIEMVRKAINDGRWMSLPQIEEFDSRAHRQNEPYGWCWAAAAFLDGHPRYRDRFRRMPEFVAGPNFAARFAKLFQADAALLAEEFQVYLANLDYAYDFARMQLDLVAGQKLPVEGRTVKIPADRGWQSSGIRLEAGKTYRIHGEGRFQVADDPRPWISEAAGVSIRYIDGHPLGMLLAAIRPDDFDATHTVTPLTQPQPVGARAELKPEQSGTLYLRINDAPGELSDNAGKLDVRVE